MGRFGTGFLQLVASFTVLAAVTGLLDASRTVAREWTSSPLSAFKVTLSIFGFDGLFLLVTGIFLSAILALLPIRYDTGLRDAVRLAARSIRPKDHRKRMAAGLSWAVWAGAGLTYLLTLYRLSLSYIESMRTPEFAAAAVALTALGLAIPVLVVRWHITRRLLERTGRRDPVDSRLGWLSPLAVAAMGVVAILPILWVARARIAAVIEVVDFEPWLLVLAGLAAAVAVALGRPVAAWPKAARALVLVVLPLAMAGSFAATLTVFGSENATRIILTRQGKVSPLAYEAVKLCLDFDGDWQLSFMGEGDCAPFDSSRYASAPEVPNNGVDEDCDGADLELVVSDRSRQARWDHEVPEDLPEHIHVVLISVDAVAPSRMSLYGYERPTTPFLDGLARDSVWFSRAFSQGPSTRLAFPSLFTSRFDSQIARRTSARIPLELRMSNIMLAEMMKQAGYYTIAVLPTTYFKNWKGLRQGFDQVNTDALKAYKKPVYHNAAEVTDSVLATLEGNERERVFLWVHYYDPHDPYTPPPEGPDFGVQKPDIYDAELAYTDGVVRRLLEGLEKVLPMDRTLVIIVGDHGEAFDAAHSKKHHGHDLRSMVLHVPLLFKAPFLKARRVETQVSTMDLAPTLVNLLGIAGDYAFEGHSLVPGLLGRPMEDTRLVFHQFYLPENVHHKKRTLRQVGVRSEELYLIMDLATNTRQLYAYPEDPFEKRNLAPSMPEALAILKKEVTAWMARVVRQ